VSCAVACDLERARNMAKKPMSGGWLAENKTNEIISQLYNNAATIAAVRQGVVQEAYAQVKSCSLFTYFLDKAQIPLALSCRRPGPRLFFCSKHVGDLVLSRF